MDHGGARTADRSWWKTHRSWIISLACVPVGYFGFGLLGGWFVQLGQQEERLSWWTLLALLLLVSAFVAPVVAAIITLRRGHRVYRAWRRSRGHLTPRERVAQQHEEGYRRAWDHARWFRASLVRRELPPEIAIWAVVPRDGERFFLDGPLTYSRYYGTDVAYTTSRTVAFGRPAYVAGALIGSAIGNSVARSRAQADAATQWREHQAVQVIASNQRIVCNVAGRGWLSFDYAAVSAIYPDPERFHIVLEFEGAASPMSLTGPMAPALATLAVLMTHGPDALHAHPALRALES
jgi:MFS family permease